MLKNASILPENDSTSLDLIYKYKTARSSSKSTKTRDIWSKKQRRTYGKIMKGLKVARKKGKTVRFLTLTTSKTCIDQKNYEITGSSLNNDFRKAKQRIKRMTPYKMAKRGYIPTSKIRYYYPNMALGEPFEFEYLKVETNEGFGVLHILYQGPYLPQTYLVDIWTEVHLSFDVNIKAITNNRRDHKKSASYIVSQYCASQGSSYVRSSMSWNWIWRGWSHDWKEYLDCNAKDWSDLTFSEYGFYYAPWKDGYDFVQGFDELMKIHFSPNYEQVGLYEFN